MLDSYMENRVNNIRCITFIEFVIIFMLISLPCIFIALGLNLMKYEAVIMVHKIITVTITSLIFMAIVLLILILWHKPSLKLVAILNCIAEESYVAMIDIQTVRELAIRYRFRYSESYYGIKITAVIFILLPVIMYGNSILYFIPAFIAFLVVDELLKVSLYHQLLIMYPKIAAFEGEEQQISWTHLRDYVGGSSPILENSNIWRGYILS